MALETDETGKVVGNCGRCGIRVSPLVWHRGLCPDCYADSFYCPRCNSQRPLSENRGAYCQPCKSEYNRQYYLSRRGLA